MKQVGDDPQEDLKRFLQQQDELQNGPVDQQLYEPQVILRPENLHLGSHVRIDAFVKLECGDGMFIGDYVHIASFAHIGIGGGTTIIEEGAAVSSGGKVISGSDRPEGLSLSAMAPKEQQVVIKYTTRLGKNCVVFTNAVVLPGVTLHEGAVLAAGSVATKDIPAFEIWGGVPAKFIKKREVKR